MTTEDQQRKDRDRAARAALFAVDLFALNTLARVHITEASRTRLTVEAALGYLIGAGLITVTPEADWPEYFEVSIPEHLRPDVDEAVRQLARINAGLPTRLADTDQAGESSP
jgi:hypothetical protein